MAKRRLSRRQRWRVSKIQQERAARADKKARQLQGQLTAGELGPEQIGLVIAHFGAQLEIEALEGELRGKIQRAHLRANLDKLVTGDRVVWRPGRSSGVVVAQLDRHSELCRPDSDGELKPVAANIDLIILVIAPEPQPHAYLIDRYLVAAEHQRISPVILLNKRDLIDAGNREALDALLLPYRDIGYRIITTSTRDDSSLQPLRQLLADHTSVFVGQSGVGKSSLINALLPAAAIRVGALSPATGKGRHTTTTARLFHFPGGGQLIDSPGIRDFGLWHLDAQSIAWGFREFRPVLGHCKFRDCSHRQDPGCALVAGVARGAISERRYQSFIHLLGSIETP